MGVENLKALVENVSKIVGIAVRSIKSGNIFSTVAGLVGAIGPVLAVKNADFPAVLAELKDLDPSERGEVEAAFIMALDVGDDALKAKIVAVVGIVDESVALVASAVQVATSAVDVVKRVRLILGA